MRPLPGCGSGTPCTPNLRSELVLGVQFRKEAGAAEPQPGARTPSAAPWQAGGGVQTAVTIAAE